MTYSKPHLLLFFLRNIFLSVTVSLEWNSHNSKALKNIYKATLGTAKVSYFSLSIRKKSMF